MLFAAWDCMGGLRNVDAHGCMPFKVTKWVLNQLRQLVTSMQASSPETALLNHKAGLGPANHKIELIA